MTASQVANDFEARIVVFSLLPGYLTAHGTKAAEWDYLLGYTM